MAPKKTLSIEKIYKQIKDDFTIANMGAVTSWLIELYRKGQIRHIEQLKQRISDFVKIEETKPNRIFSRLAMLCHPDKHTNIIKFIDKLYSEKNISELTKHNYFSVMLNEMRTPETVRVLLDPETLQSAGFSYAYGKEDLERMKYRGRPQDLDLSDAQDFLSALREKEYGNADVETEYENIDIYDEEIELSGCSIDDLSGVDRCLNLIKLDLSDNLVSDINMLSSLDLVEDLDLSNNHITDIKALKDLPRLRVLDISFNEIEDLSPLFLLADLEFVNAFGNDIQEKDLNELRNCGVIVIVSPKKETLHLQNHN